MFRDDILVLVETVQLNKTEPWRQTLAFQALERIMYLNPLARDTFREQCGFQTAVATLAQLDGVFAPFIGKRPPKDMGEGGATGQQPCPAPVGATETCSEAELLALIESVIQAMTQALCDRSGSEHVVNRIFMRREIGYDTVSAYIMATLVLRSTSPGTPTSITELII